MAAVCKSERVCQWKEAKISRKQQTTFRREVPIHDAVVVELQCGGEEVMVDTCKLLRRFPRGATYRARLLRRTSVIPAELAQEATGCQVWVEV